LARLEVATEFGALRIVGARDDVVRAAVELVCADAARGGRGIERLPFAGTDAWFKREVLFGKARARWGLKALVLRTRLPRVAEYHHLRWLAERLFLTPRPLAAGVFARRGFPTRQFLITEHVAGSTPFETWLAEAQSSERIAVVDEVAREAARMHALGFVHHDLFTRNLLVVPKEHARRVFFLDAWAGGPPPQLRGSSYDVACFLLESGTRFARGETVRFVDVYVEERAAQGRPVKRNEFVARAVRERNRLIDRLESRPAELRGRALPRRDAFG
jgi:tRNA A-37 threonylcarbamoyl transferase component Bud32